MSLLRYCNDLFLPSDVKAVRSVPRPTVCLSVCLSVTLVGCVKTAVNFTHVGYSFIKITAKFRRSVCISMGS